MARIDPIVESQALPESAKELARQRMAHGRIKSWAIELAPYKLRVISIHPTGVNTPMNEGLAALEGQTPRQIAERSAGTFLAYPGSNRRTLPAPWSTWHPKTVATTTPRRRPDQRAGASKDGRVERFSRVP